MQRQETASTAAAAAVDNKEPGREVAQRQCKGLHWVVAHLRCLVGGGISILYCLLGISKGLALLTQLLSSLLPVPLQSFAVLLFSGTQLFTMTLLQNRHLLQIARTCVKLLPMT